jgi:hypothetical protein
MKYLIQNYSDEYIILNDESNYYAGYIYPLKLGLGSPRFSVRNDDSEEIALVKSINEAIAALAAYYEKNPPRWESATRFIKWPEFGKLRVEQDQQGQRRAYRKDHELLIDGKPAIFVIPEETNRATDALLLPHGLAWQPHG